MAENEHRKALVVGWLLGGLAGAGYALWNAPMSGAQLRAKLAEGFEETIFNLMGMDQSHGPAVPDAIVPTTAQVDSTPADPPLADAAVLAAAHNVDIVIDGPRPSGLAG